MRKIPSVLTIAGSDPSGGAGIQADIKTISAHQCYAYSIITAITAQSNSTFFSTFPIPPSIVEEQFHAVLQDQMPDVIKIGMIYHPKTISLLANILQKKRPKWLIVDPVIESSSGRSLITPEGFHILKTELLPLANIITPNLSEARYLLNLEKPFSPTLKHFKDLQFSPDQFIVLTNGDCSDNNIVDMLYQPAQEEIIEYAHPTLETKHSHGTGCTFSSALAANLAKGTHIKQAFTNSINYVTNAIKHANQWIWLPSLGPLDHFYDFRKE